MPKPFYLLTGEEFLSEEALDKIRAEADTDPLSEVMLDASAPAQHIIEALETGSLLGGIRLVVVASAQDLRKEHLEALERYLASPSETSVLVAIASGRNTKLTDLAKRTGAVVTLDAPKGRRLASWIKERGRAHNLKVDDRASWALIDAVGNELRDLDGALSQLEVRLGPGAKIDGAEVRRSFARLADERIYAFTDAVGERKMAAAMGTLRRLLEQGEPPLVLFGALSNHVRRLLQAHRFDSTKAAGSFFGMPDWRVERLLGQARSYKEEELIAALGLLAKTDVDMKGDAPLPQVPLEEAVARIIAGR
ncbi:MAG: DNA polymerase III subunit delta [Actinomycetota bacterium]|nr:DNA polymerase III subunit delta [Actinomycetota bacterium]